MLQTLDDYDALLSTDRHFLLGPWLKWARAWAGDADEASRFEYGARNQLTLWGPDGEINDYAKKEWGGLVSSYYRPRYAMLFEEAQTCLDKGGVWNISSFCSRAFEHMQAWQVEHTTFPDAPMGDAIAASRAMLAKYGGGAP